MNNVDGVTKLLSILLVGMIGLLLILVSIYLIIFMKNKKKNKEKSKELIIDKNAIDEKNDKKVKTYKEYTKASIFDFMNFEKIEDNMIIQKRGRYLMAVECQGINYDLMSEIEQVSVEQGFMQFLNSLRFEIQLYIQTRTVNLQSSIDGYKEKLKPIESKYNAMQMRYLEMQKMGSYPLKEMQKAYYELTKQRNLYEYTKDIILNTEKTSLNHNVLNKKYYIIVAYDQPDAENNNYTNDEIQNMAFSELYTRSQSIIRSIMSCQVTGKILSSEELAELLYNAYNREEADTFSIERAYASGYEDLYSTAPDVLDKKIDLLNREIQSKAEQLANKKVIEAKSDKEMELQEKEENEEDLIIELAQDLINDNQRYIGKDIADKAIKKIQEDKEKSKGGSKDEKENNATKRGRPRKS